MKLATIKKRSDFLAASAKGKKIVAGTFILQAIEKPGEPMRFGFTVTKKLGNAIKRNRIKRRLRAAVTQAAIPLSAAGHDYVIIGRGKALDCPFPDLLRDMTFAFSKIRTM